MEGVSAISRIDSPTRLRYGTSEVRLRATCAVSLDTPILDIARQAANHPYVAVICVVDRRGRLVGLIPIDAPLKGLLIRIAPEALLGVGTNLNRAAEFIRLATARTAGDLMQQPTSVVISAPEDIVDTLKQMHYLGLLALPVVDAEGQVLGQIDKLDLTIAAPRGRIPDLVGK